MSKPPVKVTGWDRFLIGLAPRWGLRRVQSRHVAATLGRYYEAAGGGRRTDGWNRTASDANRQAGPQLTRLRELSRDLRRNNGWAKRGVQAIVNNAIGWGIMPRPVGVERQLADLALGLWNEWADSPRCDFDGRMTFYGLQRLALETIVESGEVLIVRQPAAAGESEALAVPLRVQVLEPDYLDLNKATTGEADPKTGHRIMQGIELDRSGRRVAYWLHQHHPGSALGGSLESRRIPAADVLHVYRVDRPGQLRGVPWLSAAIARLNDFDDYSDAVLMQQKIAACFSAFVQDFDGNASPLGTVDAGTPTVETLEPGMIVPLPPGKSITFATPPSVTDHSAFTASNLRRIAASIGVTYEDLTGDYSQVNFSSARMGRLAHWANVHDWRWNMVIPQLCDGVWRWVMDMAASLDGDLWSAKPRAEWVPPPMPMLEPDREGLAYQRLVRIGAMTVSEMIRERGGDPDAHLAEIAATNAKLDGLGIVLDCDPRLTSPSGGLLPQAKPSTTNDAVDSDDAAEVLQ